MYKLISTAVGKIRRGEMLMFENRRREKFVGSVGGVFATAYVNNFTVLLMPVHWLLIDGCHQTIV